MNIEMWQRCQSGRAARRLALLGDNQVMLEAPFVVVAEDLERC